MKYNSLQPNQFIDMCLSCPVNNSAVFNNFLFHQDPKTGLISLFPVQLRAPQSLLGLDINLSMVKQHFQRLVAAPDNSHDPLTNGLKVPVRPQTQDYPSASSSIVSDSHIELRFALFRLKTGFLLRRPPLKEVIDLLKGKFLLQTSWKKEYEDIAIGM